MMKTLLLLSTMALFLVGQGRAATHIRWNVMLNDTITPANGKIYIYGPVGGPYNATSQTVTIGAAGLIDFYLVGCPGCSYRAQWALTNVAGITTTRWEERWIVPDTPAVLTVPMLWGGSGAPQYLVSQQQINPAGLSAGEMWVWNGTAYAPGTGGGSIVNPFLNVDTALSYSTTLFPFFGMPCVSGTLPYTYWSSIAAQDGYSARLFSLASPFTVASWDANAVQSLTNATFAGTGITGTSFELVVPVGGIPDIFGHLTITGGAGLLTALTAGGVTVTVCVPRLPGL